MAASRSRGSARTGGASSKAPVKLTADAQEFIDLFGKTSEVPPKLKAALRKRIRNAADAAARDVQGEVLKAPVQRGKRSRSSDDGRTSLRAGIAGGVKVLVKSSNGKRVGVFIQASGSQLPEDQRKLIRAYNRPKGWRHPVFPRKVRGTLGALRRIAWVKQVGRPGYFDEPIQQHADDFERAVQEAMREATESLTRSRVRR